MLKSNIGDLTLLEFDRCNIEDSEIDIYGLICKIPEPIVLKNDITKTAAVPLLSSGKFIYFDHITMSISDALQEMPELRELLLNVKQEDDERSKEEKGNV